MRGVEFAGYETPRPIQIEAIPSALDGQDILGMAQTGTGKTAAFALPILEKLMAGPKKGPSVLILAPTRELAAQINSEFTSLGQFTPIRSTTVFGGVSIKRQIQALRGKPQIVVACPGRLLDLYRQRAIDLSSITTLVIDEADHMFDMGFLPDVRAIIDLVNENRQTMMFSATMPKEIRKLADNVLNNPKVVDVGHSKVVSTIQHELYPVSQRLKLPLAEFLLNDNAYFSAIIFTRTKHRAQRTAKQLKASGFNAVSLQGNMSQAQRDRAMQGFRAGKFHILVATDIAARGIDVANISFVINLDFPNTPDAYIHRIGRTGRSEQTGRAFTFVTPEDEDSVRALEHKLGRKVNRCVLPKFAEDAVPAAPQGNQNNRNGRSGQRRKPGNPQIKPAPKPDSARDSVTDPALKAAQQRLHQRPAGPRQDGPRQDGPRQDGPRSGRSRSDEERSGRDPKTHGGHQGSRGKRSRLRHRKHAERVS